MRPSQTKMCIPLFVKYGHHFRSKVSSLEFHHHLYVLVTLFCSEVSIYDLLCCSFCQGSEALFGDATDGCSVTIMAVQPRQQCAEIAIGLHTNIHFVITMLGHPAARLASPVSVICLQSARFRVVIALHPAARLASPVSVI